VQVNNARFAVAERVDVIVDFTAQASLRIGGQPV
jgi:hypothetical protein